ncbi:MAG: glycosyltransferase [Microcoleus sp. PH2017_39_LGB_O_B]|uniref:glycosyltransferase n=1 Tax=unclassified Microcoleus TaxID=2642155 RepID=UPI001E01D957|nr:MULTISPECIES: glycosyltransferase [unclassified Microcoleus]MCC3451636.1 glycosyltransferase [Microcoleus sp. PH2017_09_SFU_O_A]MCC3632546.1 glycosyltransferase [Microcoleus sp. PH2017_39_LGB_O_B]MCC3644763.1 glycosyltransferase [Microcoleus sp. PH2017_33_LGB_O_A]TAF84285.1 MAG: glycosyltransferase [Oscillatoriales cyanobacterium]
MKPNDNLVKLHIGCGTHIKEGYSNIDQYVYTSGAIQMDIFNLSFESDSVDEIFTEHMLEHIGKFEVPRALKEWARVLKPDGKLVMNLPNLEWCMQQWLAKPEQERWGWQLDTIFGLQTHPGEFHKTGFTATRLQQLLKAAGFQNINISNYWSHAQSCFWVEASKGYCTSAVKCLASIVVPWWDHSELLELWEQNLKYLPDTEIIFIDNGSAPKGKTALEEFCRQQKIKLLRNETNLGFAAANNQGAKVATGEYIIHLNNDVEIRDSPIESLCDLAAEGLAGPLAHNELGEFYLEGWALCIKRHLLEALGGWCEDYGPGYWDDVDLSHRARLGGYSLSPVPDINRLIRHITNTTGRDGRLDQLALHFENREKFIKKYYSSVPKIIVDAVFFQLYRTGIARVWQSLLEEWAQNDFAKHIVVLDRGGTTPKILGIRYRMIPLYDYATTDLDREMLQQVCNEEAADLFISTYYTTPLSTPSVFMAYDMIPEVVGANLNEPMWKEKHHAIRHASAYIAISKSTASDLANFLPEIAPKSVTVALCGVKNLFSPASQEDIKGFKNKYGISKPYFISVGGGANYKNSILFFKAFAQLASKQGFEIVCTGSGVLLEAEFRNYTLGTVVHKLQLNDDELRLAYAGAVALVYPSKYEGFGLPVLEAISCGCPVITCPNASIPEVAGEAALYVNDEDVEGLADALCEVQKPKVRNSLISAGLEQAKKFSWSKMAKTVSSALIDATLVHLNLKEINLIVFPDWSQPEESLGLELEQVVRAIATHPDKSKMTLLIDNSNISDEDANLALSSVAMSLLMEEDLDVSDGPEISLIGQLSEIQWSALIPRLYRRIVLENENKEVIVQAKELNIPTFDSDSFVQEKH